MSPIETIAEGIYMIGGPDISRSEDATSFIIDFNGELVMIDAGAGGSSRILQKNMEDGGLDPHSFRNQQLSKLCRSLNRFIFPKKH
jgi:hypothetical protein